MPNDRATPGREMVIHAETWNRLLECLADYEKNKRKPKRNKDEPLPIPTDCIKVKNISGADRSEGQVLELGTFLLTTVKKTNPWFNADTVSHNGGKSYCLLKEPIKSNKFGIAQVSGVCVAKVDIQATTDRYAYVVNSSLNLKSGEAGQFKLIGPCTSTGVQTAVVGFAEYGRLIRLCKADADIAKDASGTVSLWEYNGTTEADTGINITAKALAGDIASGVFSTAWWADGIWYVSCYEQ